MKRFLIIAILILLSGSINQSCTKEFTGYQLCGVIQDYPLGEGKIVKLCYLPESGQLMLNIESYGYSPIGSKGNFNIVSPAAPSPDKVVPLRAIFGDGINMTSPSAGGTIGLLRIFKNESATSPIGATTYENNLYGHWL